VEVYTWMDNGLHSPSSHSPQVAENVGAGGGSRTHMTQKVKGF
jgi:hypothetical protein